MGPRILLIALIAYGWTGLATCATACAEAAGMRSVVAAPTAEAASPGHTGCHGAPSHQPTPERSSDPDESPCCCVLDLAMPGETLGPVQGAARVPALVSDGITGIRTSCVIGFGWHPPRRLNSPFERQNPPLLS